nr:female-specific Ras 2 kinase suppressor [Lepeophtheirus salmonis salmonis]
MRTMECEEDEEGSLLRHRRCTCGELQIMIDVNSEHLETLRNTCSALSSELTKREIRTLEGKLIQLFGRQWSAVEGIPCLSDLYPNAHQWLRVVGLSKEGREAVAQRFTTWAALVSLSDLSILDSKALKEDQRRLSKALHNLLKFREAFINKGGVYQGDLYWDSWEVVPSVHTEEEHSSSSSSSIPSVLPKGDSAASSLSSTSGSIPPPSPGPLTLSPPVIGWDRKPTPPTTPPWSTSSLLCGTAYNKMNNAASSTTKQFPSVSSSSSENHSLVKSQSHESELASRIDIVDLGAGHSTVIHYQHHSYSSNTHFKQQQRLGRPRLATEPSILPTDEGVEPDPSPLPSTKSPAFTSPGDTDYSVSSSGPSSLQVPKSPRTPRSMGHVIRHRFKKTLKPAKCALCQEYMFSGLKCKECKYKCHRDCESNVPPSCGLPDPLVAYYMSHLSKEGSPILPRHPHISTLPPPPPPISSTSSTAAFSLSYSNRSPHSSQDPSSNRGGNHDGSYPDSSSNTSSCNSSAPSSPAVILTTNPATPHSASSLFRSHFRFPDPPISLKVQQDYQQNPVAGGSISSTGQFIQYPSASFQQKVTSPNPVIDTVKSFDSDKTLSGASGSSGSAGTAYRLDSQDSTTSVDENSSTWVGTRQTSISMREWDIAYEEVKIGDKIGSGRFSTVHQGNWHGDVAIKILNMENIDDEATLEAFRLDVATFRKTRHENLILFMGACMNPPKLAIVTSLCKGNTLYTHLHLRKDKFQINRLVQIAQQVAQGMGYLHHRGIIHKDLKTKNIFLERGKAVITDFGLVNVAGRLCARLVRPGMTINTRNNTRQDYMSIPEGWLCYLAPEIMKNLRVQPDEGDLPFNKASDVYAFGTVWFELLTMEWPWKNQPPETIIWMVGRGMKPSLANLQASRDVKDILAMCWTYKQGDRPDFTDISNNLNMIPKKRSLIRSPSHPLHLSRSAESVF